MSPQHWAALVGGFLLFLSGWLLHAGSWCLTMPVMLIGAVCLLAASEDE